MAEEGTENEQTLAAFAQLFSPAPEQEQAKLPHSGQETRAITPSREQDRPATSSGSQPEEQGVKAERVQITIPYISEDEVTHHQDECQRNVDALFASMEETADQLNESIETVLGYRPGLGGFVLKALRGTSVPAPDGRKIDALTEKLEALEEHYRLLHDRLEQSRELDRRAKAAPDIENIKTLRWRAVQMLQYQHDQSKLLTADRMLRAAQASFPSELKVEVIKEEPKPAAAKKAVPKPAAKKLLTRSKPAA